MCRNSVAESMTKTVRTIADVLLGGLSLVILSTSAATMIERRISFGKIFKASFRRDYHLDLLAGASCSLKW